MPLEMNKQTLAVKNLEKVYVSESLAVPALKGVSFEVNSNEFCIIMGASGSGKSTLLYLIGGLDSATSGEVLYGGLSTKTMSDAELSAFRRRKLGFIFQSFNLVPSLTALENVSLPLMLDGQPLSSVTDKATELLAQVGLALKINSYPGQLSGGEMQRVAIARSLIADPEVILADEPTGNLDSKNGQIVIDLLTKLSKERGKTVVMVTHDPRAADWGTRVIKMKDGLIESDSKSGL